jgi:hypothetical protein
MHSISPGTVNCSFHTHDKNAHYSTHGATAFTEIDNDNFSLLHKPHPPKGLEGRGHIKITGKLNMFCIHTVLNIEGGIYT